jgi:hypothetical protein
VSQISVKQNFNPNHKSLTNLNKGDKYKNMVSLKKHPKYGQDAQKQFMGKRNDIGDSGIKNTANFNGQLPFISQNSDLNMSDKHA